MRYAALLVASLLLAGCRGEPAAAPTDPDPTSPPTSTPTSRTPSPSPTPSDQTPGADWATVPGPTSTSVTVSGDWTLAVPKAADRAVLDGPDPQVVTAPADHRISQALIDGDHAVVVAEDERAVHPDTATVVDLATGRSTTVDGDSDVPTTTGGAWALGDGHLWHATTRGSAYCLADVDLADGTSEVAWCAARRHGFNGVRVTDAGTTLLEFDSGRPSCRTVGALVDGELRPFDAARDCAGWDALLLDGAPVWSEVADERRIEEATFFADGEELGPGTSGSLVACGGAAYFVRDPQRDGDPAQLMRWTPGQGLEVVWEAGAGGPAFLDEPRCGGTDITVTALTDDGDRQVTTAS